MSEHDRLREALAEVLGPWEKVEYTDEYGYPQVSLRVLTAEHLADAVLAVLPEHRDDVLALLGMEQVGWRIPDAAGEDGGILHDESDVPHIHHDDCEPVYAALSPTEAEEE